MQSHLRQTSQRLPGEDVLLVGESNEVPYAVAHLSIDGMNDADTAVFIAAAAVHASVRGQGGNVADELMMEIFEYARTCMTGAAGSVILTGKVHERNEPSQRMMARSGFEPVGLPSSGYQLWALRLTW